MPLKNHCMQKGGEQKPLRKAQQRNMPGVPTASRLLTHIAAK